MNDLLQIIVLSIIQGITEFLPISSSAHLIIVPTIFNWNTQGILLDVSMHFGSLLAVIIFYFKNISEFRNSKTLDHYIDTKKVLIGSLPVLVFGFLFHDYITENLRTINVIALLTIVVALLFLFTETLKKGEKKISNITNLDIFLIGIMQTTALVPGTSRSAIIILTAIVLGYNKKSSIKIALILSFPVIFAAMLYELYSIKSYMLDMHLLINISFSVFISFLVSYIVIINFLKFIDKIGFYPFMVYRLVLGVCLLVFFT
jgi:undecaprenyl-diphosphatase